MRFLHNIVCLSVLWTLLGPEQGAWGQGAALQPAALRFLPTGATDSNPYWQRLILRLSQEPSAGNTVSIALPAGVGVADTDGDGVFLDEITLASDGVSGFAPASATTARRIVLQNATGGAAGAVYVQFPITTPTNPATANASYGRIDYSNAAEIDQPAGTLAVDYVAPAVLSIAAWGALWDPAAADTTSNPQGDRLPQQPAAVFAAGLPDLLRDPLQGKSGNGIAAGDGDDGNDVGYSFWWSSQDSLARVDTTTAQRAFDAFSGQVAAAFEGETAERSFDLSQLAEGTYRLYLTSSLTGNFPLARSRGVSVRHRPAVIEVAPTGSQDDDYLDSGLLLDLDAGTAGPSNRARDRVELRFEVVDFDDSAQVALFYSTLDTLATDTSLVATSGSSPSRRIRSLAGATWIDSANALVEGRDRSLEWRIAPNDSDFVAEGRYFIYAVATDGKNIAIGRSQAAYQVRHSPFMAFDVRQDRLLVTGGETPQRYYNITWNRDNGADGDLDLDDSALISLYYSSRSDWNIPGGAAVLEAAAADPSQDTHLIAADLPEDADGRDDNRLQWDLWGFTNPDDGGVPQSGVPYWLYAVVRADTLVRLVRWEDETGTGRTLTFDHAPHLHVEAPLGPLEVDGRQSFRVAWTAKDVDDSARVWIALVGQEDALALGKRTTYGALAAADAWIGHSADGSVAAATPLYEDVDTAYDVQSARLVRTLDGAERPIGNGTYHVYLFIDAGGDTVPAAASPGYKAAGPVTLAGFEAAGAGGLTEAGLDVLPAHRRLSARGDTAVFVLKANSLGRPVDLATAFLSVDTAFVRVVDQDTARAGIQPFALASGLTGQVLVDTLQVGADSTTVGRWLLDLVYFDQAGTRRFDGQTEWARFALVSRDTLGASQIRVEHLQERQSALWRQGALVAGLAPGARSMVEVEARGQIAGRVPLQGRLDHSAPLTLLLRRHNSVEPIDDALFIATNDADTTRPGIQDTTDAEGRFRLLQVPSGQYHLAVHVDGYLDGQYPSLRVDPGAVLEGIDPTLRDDGVTDPGVLLGGDVTGYIDTSGLALPDNEVDQLDVDFVVAFFGQRLSSGHAGLRADVDGDSLVWVGDLNMAAANFNGSGVEPVFKVAAQAPPELRLVPGQRAGVVHVEAPTLAPWRAYGFRVLYDAATTRPLSYAGAPAFGPLPAAYAAAAEPGQLIFGGALLGTGEGGADRPVRLATLRFATADATVFDASALGLGAVEAVDGSGRHWRGVQQRPLPGRFRLLPNSPNPFNPQTALRLSLPRDGAAVLEIFDIAGQRVRVLHRGFLGAGWHRFDWDGRDQKGKPVGSGVYVARLRGTYQNGAAAESRIKMLLLR